MPEGIGYDWLALDLVTKQNLLRNDPRVRTPEDINRLLAAYENNPEAGNQFLRQLGVQDRMDQVPTPDPYEWVQGGHEQFMPRLENALSQRQDLITMIDPPAPQEPNFGARFTGRPDPDTQTQTPQAGTKPKPRKARDNNG